MVGKLFCLSVLTHRHKCIRCLWSGVQLAVICNRKHLVHWGSSILKSLIPFQKAKAELEAMQHVASISFLHHSVFNSLSNPVMPSYSYQSCSLKQFQFPTWVAICFLTVLSFCVKSILNLKPSQAAVLDSTGWMKALFQTGKICYLNSHKRVVGTAREKQSKAGGHILSLWWLPKLWMKNRFVYLNYCSDSFSTMFFC